MQKSFSSITEVIYEAHLLQSGYPDVLFDFYREFTFVSSKVQKLITAELTDYKTLHLVSLDKIVYTFDTSNEI